jgi:hypothetical protein
MEVLMKIINIFVLFTFLLVQCAYASGEIGQFTYTDGNVDIKHLGSSGSSPALTGQPVYQGDIIRTKSYSKAEIKFNDDSIVRIAPSSRLEIEEYLIKDDGKRDRASLLLSRGKIRTIVSKTQGDVNFSIKTPNAQGSVKGSDILVFYQADNTGVLVNHGAIDMHNLKVPEGIVSMQQGDVLNVPYDKIPEGLRQYMDLELKLHTKDTDPPQEGKAVAGGKLPEMMLCHLIKTTGDVNYRRTDKGEWKKGELNQILIEDDEIDVKENSTAQIRFDNGNSVNLQPNSQITIKTLRRDPKTGEYENILESKHGKIKAVVEKLPGKSKFHIRTPVALCGVRGR